MSGPEAYRVESRERWERSATGWAKRREPFERAVAPVTAWLRGALAPAPGETLLELAAGPGEAGLAMAADVRPDGRVLLTDGAEGMVTAAREEAERRGLADVVEARAMEAEWIDLPAGTVDAVLCRWGYMLLADPGAALRETRRVLKPATGRLALSAWTGPDENPWARVPRAVLEDLGALAGGEDPSAPGQFAWRERDTIVSAIAGAGFVDWRVERLGFSFAYPSVEAWLESQRDLSVGTADAWALMDDRGRAATLDGCAAAVRDHTAADGSLELPAATWCAWAE